MKITEDMFQAFQKIAERRGGQADLVRKSGLSKQHIQKYVAGNVKGITLENWLKLEPHLRPYMKVTYNQHNNSGITQSVTGNIITGTASSIDLKEAILADKTLDAEQKRKLTKLLLEMRMENDLNKIK